MQLLKQLMMDMTLQYHERHDNNDIITLLGDVPSYIPRFMDIYFTILGRDIMNETIISWLENADSRIRNGFLIMLHSEIETLNANPRNNTGNGPRNNTGNGPRNNTGNGSRNNAGNGSRNNAGNGPRNNAGNALYQSTKSKNTFTTSPLKEQEHLHQQVPRNKV